MSLQKKLLILTVVLNTTITVIFLSLKINHEGIRGLEDKSNSTLLIDIKYFIERHINGSIIEENDRDELIQKSDLATAKKYKFRISSTNPQNSKYLASEIELEFIDQFVNKDSKLRYSGFK